MSARNGFRSFTVIAVPASVQAVAVADRDAEIVEKLQRLRVR